MRNIVMILIALAVVSFLLAIITALWLNTLLGIEPEGYSFGCTNLSLIAIALLMLSKNNGKSG